MSTGLDWKGVNRVEWREFKSRSIWISRLLPGIIGIAGAISILSPRSRRQNPHWWIGLGARSVQSWSLANLGILLICVLQYPNRGEKTDEAVLGKKDPIAHSLHQQAMYFFPCTGFETCIGAPSLLSICISAQRSWLILLDDYDLDVGHWSVAYITDHNWRISGTIIRCIAPTNITLPEQSSRTREQF